MDNKPKRLSLLSFLWHPSNENLDPDRVRITRKWAKRHKVDDLFDLISDIATLLVIAGIAAAILAF